MVAAGLAAALEPAQATETAITAAAAEAPNAAAARDELTARPEPAETLELLVDSVGIDHAAAA